MLRLPLLHAVSERCGHSLDFEIYNDGVAYNVPNRGRGRYIDTLLDGRRGDQCIHCNSCIEACPQKIDIPDWLEKIHQLLGAPKAG